MAKAATPAVAVLERAGVAYRLHHYDFAPAEDGIGMQAAAALDVAPKRLLKTLVIDVEGAGPALALLAVDRTLDLKLAAKALGAKRALMATPAKAERATGYVKGGISPLGTRRRLPAVIDRSTLDHDHVLVNGGRRGLQIELSTSALVQLITAAKAMLARG